MKAISKFKGLLHSRAGTPRKETPLSEGGDKTPRPPGGGEKGGHTQGLSGEDKIHAEHAARLIAERMQFLREQSSHGEKGHAHDPTNVEPLYLGIGTGGHDDFS